MNYKEIIESSVSALDKAYPCSDHGTALSKVLERTENMKEKNDGFEHRKLFEITPARVEPKKSRRIFMAFAGTAAAVAVIGGSVWGINYLKENGGLKQKEPVTSTGAGYHETAASGNDPTNGGMFLTQSDKDLLEGNASPAVDIPEGTRYDFNGFYVEPRWCTFDGMTLHLAYDVVYEGEMPADIENNVKIESENGLVSGYMLNSSDMLNSSESRVVMKASVCYPKIVRTAKVDLVSGADGTRYTFTADIPESVHLFSADLIGTDIPFKDSGITKKLTHIDASASGLSLIFENKPEVRNIATLLDPIIRLTDGTEIIPAATISTQDWYERQEDDKLLIRFTTQRFDPSDIDEIRVNDIIVYLSSSPAGSPDTDEGETEDEISTYIAIDYSRADVLGRYEFLYYIDGELQNDMTETRELSGTDEFRWDVTGSGTHTYRVLLRNPETRWYEILFEVSIDFTKPEPEKTFIGEFDPKIFKNVAEKQVDFSQIEGIYAPGELPYETTGGGELPYEATGGEETSGDTSGFTLPEALCNGNGFYGPFLDGPIVGDDAWALVKERSGTDLDYVLPFDKNLFVFDGAEFFIYGEADCDVTALVGGTVESVGYKGGFGLSVLIRDDNGHYWFWYHLSKANVSEGDSVEAGARIGHTGSSGVCHAQHTYSMRVG